MNSVIKFFVASLWLGLLFMPQMAVAFSCTLSEQSFPMAAVSIPASSAASSLSSGTFTTSCSGSATSAQKDAMRIESVTVNSVFLNEGYIVEVSIGGGAWQTAAAVKYACIWPASNTSYNCISGSSSNDGNTRSITIRVRRSSNVAIKTPIPNNTNIATIVLYQRSSDTWSGSGGWAKITLNYYLNGDISPLVPTCNITNADKKVTLPDVKRAELVSYGPGRFPRTTSEFSINLECKYQPKVSVQFDGTKMTGVASGDVLGNQLSGNDNVGVQIMYDNSVIKLGEKIAVLSAATENESLKFNAYYYFNGGSIQGGPMKANTEFTFTYD